MNKKKVIEKLTEQIIKLESLPPYNYHGDNTEFDKWKRFTIITIEKLLGSSHSKEFGNIRFSPGSFLMNSDGHEFIEAHNDGRKKTKAKIESFIEELEEFGEEESKQENKEYITMDKSKVFIVHGHDNEMKQEVARFIEKIEEHTNVGFGIVLYSSCDVGGKSENDLRPRARQNVVFEHGYLIAKLKRQNVTALVKGTIETPGDISGVVYISMSSSWEVSIAQELDSAGYKIDFNKLFKK